MSKYSLQSFDYFAKKPRLRVDRFSTVSNSPYSHLRITDLDTELFGEGSAFQLDLAQSKALSELVERTVFSQLEINNDNAFKNTTNGYAAYPDEAQASERAIAELIERHAFLTCWLANQRPLWISEPEIVVLLPDSAYDEVSRYADLGFKLNVGRVALLAETYHVLVACLQPLDGSFAGIFTTACSRSQADAALTTILNQDRALAYIAAKSRSIQNNHATEIQSPQYHMDHYLTAEVSSIVKSYLDVGSCLSMEIPKIQLNVWNVPLWNGQSTFVAAASCEGAQDYFSGHATLRKINRDGLRRIMRSRPYRINRALHPLS